MKNKFTPWLQSIGIVLPLMGSGLIFFIRTLLPSFSNPSFVTLFFQLISLAFLFTNNSFKVLYKGNKILFTTFILFLLYTLIFFLFNNSDSNYTYYNILYLFISFVYAIQIHKINYEITEYLIKTIFVLTFLINVSLIYSIINNPFYAIGMRATVSFLGENNSGFTGNPHIYARNGIVSLIISLLLLFRSNEEKIINLILYWISFFLSLIILIITMVKTALVLTPFVLFLFYLTKKPLFYDLKQKNNLKFKKIFSLILLFTPFLFFNFSKLLDIILIYYDLGFQMVNNSISTIFGSSIIQNTNIDPSTMGRILNLKFVNDLLIKHPIYFLFGNGFRYYYVDVPFVEVFLNFGLIGIILFSIYIFFTYYFSLKNIFINRDLFQLFISLYILSGILSLFTQGRPMELGLYIHAAFYIRFLSTDQIKP